MISGNGFFKPNISALVGQLYPKHDRRIDPAYTIFYLGINVGGALGPFVCGLVGDTGNPADFKWAFLAGGIGMLLSVIVQYVFHQKYVVDAHGAPLGETPDQSPRSRWWTNPVFMTVGLAVLSVLMIGLLYVDANVFSFDRHSPLPLEAGDPEAAGASLFWFSVRFAPTREGLFNAIAAPLVFDAHHEFPLAIAAAAGLAPAVITCRWSTRLLAACAIVATLVGVLAAAPWIVLPRTGWLVLLALAVTVATVTLTHGRKDAGCGRLRQDAVTCGPAVHSRCDTARVAYSTCAGIGND
jgi:MFS family permease